MEFQGQGLSLSDQTNIIKNVLNDWASTEQGIAVVGEELNEKLLTGFNNTIGPKCIVFFTGEDAYGDENSQELLGMTMRNFDVIVQRGKILSDPRNSALTQTSGPSKPFYDLIESARDVCRSIEFPTPMCMNPAIYHGIKAGNSDGWLIDSYIISFSVLTQIGRVQAIPPQLGTGPFVQLQDPLPVVQNLSL